MPCLEVFHIAVVVTVFRRSSRVDGDGKQLIRIIFLVAHDRVSPLQSRLSIKTEVNVSGCLVVVLWGRRHFHEIFFRCLNPGQFQSRWRHIWRQVQFEWKAHLSMHFLCFVCFPIIIHTANRYCLDVRCLFYFRALHRVLLLPTLLTEVLVVAVESFLRGLPKITSECLFQRFERLASKRFYLNAK